MSLPLCASCRHHFPGELLEKASFTESVGQHIDEASRLLGSIAGRGPEDTDRLERLRSCLQNLCAAIHVEAATLQKRASTAEEQCLNRQRDLETVTARLMASTAGQAVKSGTDSAACLAGAMDGPRGGGGAGGQGVSTAGTDSARKAATFGGQVQSHNLRRANTALELVSAGVYAILESLAVQARADTALLWLRPNGFLSVELVAPFVVGRDVRPLRNSAPYRAQETSLPCAVSTTGIGINLKPRDGVSDTRATESIPLNELIDSSNAAQLLVPVYSRYSEHDRTVLAVIHLIGSPRFPFPFSRRNEASAMHAANFLSTIISAQYNVMISEWTNHFYDVSAVQQTGQYQAALDLRADEKGADDFAPPVSLIYRCVNDRKADADPRETQKSMKTMMRQKAQPMAPVTTVRELHRHAANMESNWVSAVANTTQLENLVGTLREETLREEVEKLRERRDHGGAEAGKTATADGLRLHDARTGGDGPSGAAHDLGKPGRRPATGSAGAGAAADTTACGVLPAPTADDLIAPSGDLRPEQVDALEIAAMQRLRELGVDPTTFLSR